MFVKILASILLLQAIAVQAQNWCDPAYCGDRQHVACNNNGQFAPACVNPVNVPITQALIDQILDTHNSMRNRLASGGVSSLRRAARMATLSWSPTLAQHATLNTRQCVMHHDACRNTADFRYAGQNLGATLNYNAPETASAALATAMNMWFDEYPYADQSHMDRIAGTVGINGQVIGHFTQIVQDRATHVGCGITSYLSGSIWWNLIACNYARSNVISQVVYTSSATAGSGCTSGMNPSYPALCSINESIDPNEMIW